MNLINRPTFTEANGVKDLQQLFIRRPLLLGLSGVLLQKLNQQAMRFTGIGNELTVVVKAFLVNTDHFFR